jgi:hypothetical protein
MLAWWSRGSAIKWFVASGDSQIIHRVAIRIRD